MPETRLNREAVVREMADWGDVETGAEAGDPGLTALGPSRGVKVKVAQSCPTLCDPMDYTVHGILQARILEWAAFPFSRGSSQPRD